MILEWLKTLLEKKSFLQLKLFIHKSKTIYLYIQNIKQRFLSWQKSWKRKILNEHEKDNIKC